MSDDDSEGIFAKAGFVLPTAKKDAGDTKAAVPGAAPKSIFEEAGFEVPGAKKAPAPEPESDIPTPERFAETYARQGNKNPENKSTLQQIREDIDPATLISTGATNAYRDIVANAVSGARQLKQAISDKGGNLLPSLGTPATKDITVTTPFGSYPAQQNVYPNAQPGRILQGAMGALGVAGSWASGATNALVTRPV